MTSAILNAEAAHGEAKRLNVSIQTLIDAVGAGCTVTLADLHFLHKDCSVLCYAVARTFHAVKQEEKHRRTAEVTE